MASPTLVWGGVDYLLLEDAIKTKKWSVHLVTIKMSFDMHSLKRL